MRPLPSLIVAILMLVVAGCATIPAAPADVATMPTSVFDSLFAIATTPAPTATTPPAIVATGTPVVAVALPTVTDGTGVTFAGLTNCRVLPTRESHVVAVLPAGSTLIYDQQDGDWYRVVVAGAVCWGWAGE